MIDTGFDWMLAPLVWLALLGGMLLAMQAGARLRVRHLRAAHSDAPGFAAVHGAVFALLGLLIAFTFSGAATRSHRRDLIVEEANDIGTAYLRIALLPEAARGPLQERFRETWTPGFRPIAPGPTSCASINCYSKPLNARIRYGRWRWSRSAMPPAHPWPRKSSLVE